MKFRVMTVALAASLSAACSGGSSTGGLDAEQTYSIALTQAQEVPTPKVTNATGIAQIVVLPGEIDYTIDVANINAVTMAHIHNGAPGVAGPIVVTLFQSSTPTGPISSKLAAGTITQASLGTATTLESLKALLLSGNAYINVHTTGNPAGEIRGQIK